MIYDGVCLFLPNWCVAMRFLMFFRFQQDFSIWPLRLSVFCSLLLHQKKKWISSSRIWIVRNVCTQSFCFMALLFCCISAFKIFIARILMRRRERVCRHTYMCGFYPLKNVFFILKKFQLKKFHSQRSIVLKCT